MSYSLEQVSQETRRPMLVQMAKQLGISVTPGATAPQIKESIMAAVKTAPVAAPKSAPAKPAAPAPKAPVAPPKAPAAPAKPAAPPKPAAAPVAPPKAPAAPAKPAAPAAPAKPAAPPTAPAKPAAPAPVAPAKPAANADALKEFNDFKAEVTGWMEATANTLEALASRLDRLELTVSGYGPFTAIDEEGNVVLQIEEADRETLRQWAFAFGVGDYNADTDTIRAALLAQREAGGFEVVNEGDVPAEEAAPEATAVEEAAAEEEEQTITDEQIDAMNWTALVQLCETIGLDISDLKGPGKPQQPKVLRQRIKEALAAAQEPEAEAEAAEGEVAIGAAIKVTHEGTVYDAAFGGYTDDGMIIVTWGDGTQNPMPADAVALA